MKKQMTHAEKTRYLYYISQGIEGAENEKDLVYNFQSSNAEDLHVPLDQVIYVGDGASDVPCFDVMGQYGGMSIGIYGEGHSAKDWENLESITKTQKLSNLVPAGYKEDSELVRSLYLCVECIAKRIALRKLREEGIQQSDRKVLCCIPMNSFNRHRVNLSISTMFRLLRER
ncbi:hypothetical protein [Leptolyngbya sp. BC1307]|uniref:hypothetical protein n=1 Tax=Leptolyngbya sp. BC1307 TaxID=2029589 RepID=UPI001140B7A1|nr:hypothetical protein [Leptolyngbya sp. BC1307]